MHPGGDTGGPVTVADVLLFPAFDFSQRCRLAPQAVQKIVDSIARALNHHWQSSLLRDVVRNGGDVITTGDASLDEILGDGIKVGMIWQLVGERLVVAYGTPLTSLTQLLWVFSAADKTQLAL